jgi:uncharacterized protein YecT (DUF1311 family)
MAALKRVFVAAVLALSLPSAAAWGAAGFDCGKAQTSVEKAICANPPLAAADSAMAQAYDALAKAVPAEQKAALLSDQRKWVAGRAAGCEDKKGEAFTACLLADTEERRRFLAGEGPNGASGAPRLLPTFLAETKKGAYEISVEYPQFAAPHDPKFNTAVRELTIAPKDLADYRDVDPQRPAGSSNYYDVGYTIDYLGPRLAVFIFGFSGFAGGAHPNSWRSAVWWNPETDAPVTLADMLADPEKAVPAIASMCKDKLSVEAKAEGWDFFDDADFAGVVKDTASWSLDKDGVTIIFNPYSVAAYVVGPRDCALPFAELSQWLKPGGPLPPQ